ncbi:MAG TPA: hypothetical protein VF110_02175, partial [Burkholderiales bacterium]
MNLRRLSAAALIAFAAPAMAEEGPIRGGTEKFKLSFGTILNNNDTTMTLQGPQGRGIEFGLEGAAGVERDRWSTLASATWRFAPNHRVGFQSFAMRRHGNKTIDQELVIKDETIPIGTSLQTTAKTDFLIVNYQYSLMRDDRVELSAMAGIYGARFRYSFDSTNPPRAIDAKTTAPLPMFGLALDTFLTPRWTIGAFLEGFALKVGDVEGRMTYIGLTTDYMLTRHLGLGMGISAVHVGADVTQDDF